MTKAHLDQFEAAMTIGLAVARASGLPVDTVDHWATFSMSLYRDMRDAGIADGSLATADGKTDRELIDLLGTEARALSGRADQLIEKYTKGS